MAATAFVGLVVLGKVLLDRGGSATAIVIATCLIALVCGGLLAPERASQLFGGLRLAASGSRRLPIGAAPGLVLGYFLAPAPPAVAVPHAVALTLAVPVASATIYLLLARTQTAHEMRRRALDGAFIGSAVALFSLFVSTDLLAILGWNILEITIVAQALIVGVAFLWWLAYLDRPISEHGERAPAIGPVVTATPPGSELVGTGMHEDLDRRPLPSRDLKVPDIVESRVDSPPQQLDPALVSAKQPDRTMPATSEPSQSPVGSPVSVTADGPMSSTDWVDLNSTSSVESSITGTETAKPDGPEATTRGEVCVSVASTPPIEQVRVVDKPWGHEEIFALVPGKFCGKVLHVQAGHSLSLQYHEVKEELISVQHGAARVEVGDDPGALAVVYLGPGEGVHLPPKRIHRITAMTDLVLLEASTTELDDVVRLEDRYGRAGTSQP